MSILIMSEVWKHAPADKGDLLILLALADHADDEGRCFPSVSTLADKGRMTERNVKRCLRSLEDSGVVRTETAAGPRGCNVYIVDVAAMRALPKNAVAGDDKMSPHAGDEGGDKTGAEGVTKSTGGGDAGVTRTIIEPPIEPSEREGARERVDRDQEEDQKHLLKRVKALELGRNGNPWPGAIGSSTTWALQQFEKLSPEERQLAEERRDAYLALCPKDKNLKPKAVALGVYLRDRKFLDVAHLAPAASRKAEAVTIAPFGPVWAAKRFLALLAGPCDGIIPENLYEAVARTHAALERASETRAAHYLEGKGIAIDAETGDLIFPENFATEEYRRRMLKDGYPDVAKLDDAARHRQPLKGNEDDQALAGLCEPVPVNSETLQTWKAAFDERLWPWLPDFGAMKVAYFPKGGPGGLYDFEAQARAILQHGRSEAAE